MRIAIISDIHGNCIALDAVSADLRPNPVDQIVCLGDAVQGGPRPGQVVARLREIACPVVMGNADAWLLSGQETGNEQIPAERLRKMRAIRDWSLSPLTAEDGAFIGQFEPTVTTVPEAGRRLLCFHGSPASFDDILLPTTPEEEFERLLGGYATFLLTGEHTTSIASQYSRLEFIASYRHGDALNGRLRVASKPGTIDPPSLCDYNDLTRQQEVDHADEQ